MAKPAAQIVHYWSKDPIEVRRLTSIAFGWLEEASFFTPVSDEPGTIPVFRYYNAERQQHFWTIDKQEPDHHSFVLEKEAYRVFDLSEPQPADARPLIRFKLRDQNEGHVQHFWTATPEHEMLSGWEMEEPIGYVYPNIPQTDHCKIHRYLRQELHPTFEQRAWGRFMNLFAPARQA